MTPQELKSRARASGLRWIRLVGRLPRDAASQIMGRQILRSGTSGGANYRAACRARSRADFAGKLALVKEEAHETLDWLELLQKSGLVKADRLADLIKEAEALVAIITTSRKTVQEKINLSGRKLQILNPQSKIPWTLTLSPSRRTRTTPS